MRILFVTTDHPWPPRRGYQLRVAGLAEELVARHEIAIVAAVRGHEAERASPSGIAVRTVALGRLPGLWMASSLWRLPLQVAHYRHPALCRAVCEEVERQQPDVVVPVLSRLGFVLDEVGDRPVVVDLVDALGLNMANRAARQAWAAPLFAWEGWRMMRWERQLLDRASRVTVVADRDRQALAHRDGALASRLQVVPVGVTVPPSLAAFMPPSGAPIVLLSGNLGYFPTVDGARWFVHRVWPQILSTVPEARFVLAGARPGASIRRLARLPGVEVIAEPEDLAALRRRATVAIAPLRAGSGTPIKILEAMADGVPVVTRSAGYEGLDELVGGEVAVADEPADFAAAVSDLLKDPSARLRQAIRARQWLAERHDRARVADSFEAVLKEAVAAGKVER